MTPTRPISLFSKHLIAVCFALFALSSCTVKESLLGVLQVDYAKPLNKTKTTSPFSACVYAQSTTQQVAAAKKIQRKLLLAPVAVWQSDYVAAPVVQTYLHDAKHSSGSSPPKYILYKRLKLDVAGV